MSMVGYPWKVSPNSDEAEEIMQGDVPQLPSESPVITAEPPRAAMRGDVPRKLYVKTDVLKQIGYTTGCPGCRALQVGKPRVGHSDACRHRASEAMRGDAAGRQRLKATRDCENEFLARAVRDEDERKAKQSGVEVSPPAVADPPIEQGVTSNSVQVVKQEAGVSSRVPDVATGVVDGRVLPAVPDTDLKMGEAPTVASQPSSLQVNPASSQTNPQSLVNVSRPVASSSGYKRPRDVSDEGDQELLESRVREPIMTSDGDIDMSSLPICECSLEEDFPGQHENELSDDDLIASVGQANDGDVRIAVEGRVDEGADEGDEEIPNRPSDDIITCRCDPALAGERVVPLAIKPTFVEWVEGKFYDDLTGEELPPELVKAAKREEITEMYRRAVWSETDISKCHGRTRKPPIPVRWAIINKGDKKNYVVRARLVAKHLVAKYGGKGLHELFAAMPAFEMVKLLLVRALSHTSVRYSSRKGAGATGAPKKLVSSRKSPSMAESVRKPMFIDVSKVHLYALIDADVNAFVGLPPECRKPGVCGEPNYWLYGMRPASKGWESE